MPVIGEVKKGKEIGKLSNKYRCYIWQSCSDCGREVWIELKKGLPRSLHCRACSRKSGPLAHNWQGGKCNSTHGYILVLLSPGDFFFPMTQGSRKRYAFEHRLVMARHLKRCLLPWEVVHHKNGIKDDNRLENLQLLKGGANHAVYTLLQATIRRQTKQIKELQTRVLQLEAEFAVLSGCPDLDNDWGEKGS